MTRSPRVTAVVVTFRSRALIGSALGGLEPAHAAGLADAIVVDNASDDGTAAFVRERFPWVPVIEAGDNLGFGRGCNLGLGKVVTPYVLFLNPDAVIESDALTMLLDFLDARPEAGLAAPAIRSPGGVLQVIGGLPSPWGILAEAAGHRPNARRELHPGEAPFRTDWLCGAVLLGRTSLLRELGGFDPRFFLYFEETDLCRRVLARGSEIWAIGQAVAFHVDAATTRAIGEPMYAGCIAEHYFRSRFYYLVKHFGWLAAAATELTELALLGLRGALGRVRGRGRSSALSVRLRAPLLARPPFPGRPDAR